jgi:formylglycine-generating enzyme required for sulfatase activity
MTPGRWTRCLAFAAAVLLLAAGAAHAEKRVALVIGNDRYPNLAASQQLQKAVNDAEAVGDTLERLGFKVIRGKNLGRQDMIDTLAEFTANIATGDVAAFFYAGHGVAIGGVNYLVPSDVPRMTEGAEPRVRGASISEPDLIAEIRDRNPRVTFLTIDACRDNPFPRSSAGRSIGNTRGLADAKPPSGVFSIYSAGIGQTALDRLEPNDPHRNSVFTRMFVEHLGRPGLDLAGLAIEVRERVADLALKAKNDFGRPEPHEQTPAYYDQTRGGRIYLAGVPPAQPAPVLPPPPVAAAPPPPQDELFWSVIKESTVPAVFEEFLARHGASARAGEARARLEQLRRAQSAALAPPAPASAAAAPQPRPSESRQPAALGSDDLVWTSIRNSRVASLFESFLAAHPASRHAGEARARLDELKRTPQAAVAPVAAAPLPSTVLVPAPGLSMGAPPVPSGRPQPAQPAGEDERVWSAIRTSSLPMLFENFLAQHPGSRFAPEARQRLQALKGAQSAAIVPTVAPPRPQSSEQVQPAVGVFPQPARSLRPLTPEQERALQPKDTFKECDVCPEMVVVPAGSFMMGAPASENSSGRDERPQRRVTFARPFAVGKFSVTFGEWRACVADGGCSDSRYSLPVGDDYPVFEVSWDDVGRFLSWLSRKTGKTYRLPSEAEREYVTRAGTATPFWTGATISTGEANYDGREIYGNGTAGEWRRGPLPVGALPPNPWGLHHVHGNLWEWTADCWNASHSGAPADGSARMSGDCRRRVARGGYHFEHPARIRSAARRESGREGGWSTSFRVARSLP